MAFEAAMLDGGSLESCQLLLASCDTIIEMAQLARQHEERGETWKYFAHLEVHCLRIKYHGDRPPYSLQDPSSALVNNAIVRLASIIPTSGLQELPQYETTAEYRLRILSDQWRQKQPKDGHAALEFAQRWLHPRMNSSGITMDAINRDLERCADNLDKARMDTPSRPSDAAWKHQEHHQIFSLGVSKAAQEVYEALLMCRACLCLTSHEIGVRLEMDMHRIPGPQHQKKQTRSTAPIDDQKFDEKGWLSFGLFFSKGDHWQETCVQAASHGGLHFDIPSDQVSNPSKGTGSESRDQMDLCRTISKVKNKKLQRLLLILRNGRLFEKNFEKSRFRINKDSEAMSLLECFERRREVFNEKTRQIMSLIMGYTVFHLHDTQWLQPGWGSHTVKFFPTTTPNTPMGPFLQAKLPRTQTCGGSPTCQASEDLQLAKRCPPALVALAVVLMEIHSMRSFKSLAEEKDIQLDIEPNGQFNPIDVDLIFHGEEESNIEGWGSGLPQASPLHKAIRSCLNDQLWEDEDGRQITGKRLSTQIYEHVLQPLERHFKDGWPDIELDDLDGHLRSLNLGDWVQPLSSSRGASPMHLSSLSPFMLTGSIGHSISARSSEFDLLSTNCRNSQGAGPSPNPLLLHSSQEPLRHLSSTVNVPSSIACFFDDEMGSQDDVTSYNSWKRKYEDVFDKFITQSDPDSASKPVKIAILDTGVDGERRCFNIRENIKGKHNFHDPEVLNAPDTNGHGTFVASLVLDFAPHSDLYIIKIVDDNDSRPDARTVAKAIDYAVETWNVDIINMSFGWPSSAFDGHSELRAAIERAYGRKVIMLAAASNRGGQLGRAYPASDTHVIGVHSTDAYGNGSRFNPTAEPYSINIATVGETVQSTWTAFRCDYKSNPQCVAIRSGTSYATAIIAGIVAFLLQFATIHGSESMVNEMKRKGNMERLLKRCGIRGNNDQPRDGYFYVHLSLDKHNLFGEDLDGVKREIIKSLQT